MKQRYFAPTFFLLTSFQKKCLTEEKDTESSNVLKNDVSGKTVLSVSKTVSRKWDEKNINVYENEKKWLEKLKDTDIIARPIHFDDENRIITTEYAGEQLDKDNLPADWEAQRDKILEALAKHNCRHNDIKPTELVIQDGKIRLVDFGWAYDYQTPNPVDWPNGLGDNFKCGDHFDDKCSFNKSVNHILSQNETKDEQRTKDEQSK